ncbi:MAG: biotin--[acetyl-CoA-carboxylase] ligase, partial [Lentisphaerota bacterium]
MDVRRHLHREISSAMSAQQPVTPSVMGQTILRLGEVVSTNDVAREKAEAQAPEGYTVIAARQTGGRGRRGRTWTSPEGKGLYMSVILRPTWPASEAGWLSTLGGVVVAAALESLGLQKIFLKWPNDVLIKGRKIAGILIEPRLSRDRIEFAVMGMGVNVRQLKEDWGDELVGRATSCLLEKVDIPFDI